MRHRVLGVLCLLAVPVAAQEQAKGPNWPSFRGEYAAGVADGQNLPDAWNGEKSVSIKWKARIPGLAHSSPVVWDDRIFVTTAISSQGNATFKQGLYGEGNASEDEAHREGHAGDARHPG